MEFPYTPPVARIAYGKPLGPLGILPGQVRRVLEPRIAASTPLGHWILAGFRQGRVEGLAERDLLEKDFGA